MREYKDSFCLEIEIIGVLLQNTNKKMLKIKMNKCLMSTKFNIPVSLIVTLSDHEN